MIKKILAALLAAIMLCSIFASCGEELKETTETSSTAVGEIQTSSVATSSKRGTVDRGDGNESETTSDGVKVFKNPNNVMLGCFHFSPNWCTALGSDYDSRLREFEAVVKEGYFNTFLMGMDEYFIDAVKIIAKYGGSVWVSAGNFDSKGGKLKYDLSTMDVYFNILKKNGLYDLVNGFYWDEPIWHGQTNDDFLTQTETLYKTYGLRNFPVFACGEFSNSEGNENQLGTSADSMRKLTRSSLKYVTDLAYDSYSVDVREGAPNGNGKYAEWSESYGVSITNGKEYYTAIKKYLQKFAGHDANYWYYPTAYACYLWGGLNGIRYADDAYCSAMLEFMADDVLKEKHPGGLIVYNYCKFSDSGVDAFQDLCDVKNADGTYMLKPQTEKKWTNYCNVLRETTKKFNSIKPNLVDLG